MKVESKRAKRMVHQTVVWLGIAVWVGLILLVNEMTFRDETAADERRLVNCVRSMGVHTDEEVMAALMDCSKVLNIKPTEEMFP